jgi:hypothetical protein
MCRLAVLACLIGCGGDVAKNPDAAAVADAAVAADAARECTPFAGDCPEPSSCSRITVCR